MSSTVRHRASSRIKASASAAAASSAKTKKEKEASKQAQPAYHHQRVPALGLLALVCLCLPLSVCLRAFVCFWFVCVGLYVRLLVCVCVLWLSCVAVWLAC